MFTIFIHHVWDTSACNVYVWCAVGLLSVSSESNTCIPQLYVTFKQSMSLTGPIICSWDICLQLFLFSFILLIKTNNLNSSQTSMFPFLSVSLCLKNFILFVCTLTFSLLFGTHTSLLHLYIRCWTDITYFLKF